MPLPNFIIIGAMKSGTSTLHSNLQLHPKIGMSRLKEPNYFSKNHSKGIDWYKSQFNSGKIFNGEATPAYTWNHLYPDVPSRIHEILPNAKLIYVVRDPIDRIISHLHHDLYRDRFKLSEIDEVVFNDSQYIMTSKYYSQLEKYLEFFSIDNIMVVNTYDLKNNLNNSLNQICEFLGLEEFSFENKSHVRNQSERKYLIKNHDQIHNILPRRLCNLYHLMYYFINIKINRPDLKPATLIRLKKELINDVNEMKKLSLINPEKWRTYSNIDGSM